MQTNDANIVPHKSLFVISPMIAVDFICLLRSTKMLVSFSLKFVACTFIYINLWVSVDTLKAPCLTWMVEPTLSEIKVQLCLVQIQIQSAYCLLLTDVVW